MVVLIVMILLCDAAVSGNHVSAVTSDTAVKPVAWMTTSDADISSDGEEFCDSFDVSTFSVRLPRNDCSTSFSIT